ncbi:DDE-type integrase/transposase/recombinase [Rhodococcus erythropolis]|uniref:DDE-type integrase/transposase/recombinase n=1 Tax=Rhodococcus erythropolis TaxID=1833 RepID=UPI003B8A70B6
MRSRTSCGSPILRNTRAREGKAYRAVYLDTFSRRVVGWSIDSSQTATLVTNALGMAISNRGQTPAPTTEFSSRPGRSPAEPTTRA